VHSLVFPVLNDRTTGGETRCALPPHICDPYGDRVGTLSFFYIQHPSGLLTFTQDFQSSYSFSGAAASNTAPRTTPPCTDRTERTERTEQRRRRPVCALCALRLHICARFRDPEQAPFALSYPGRHLPCLHMALGPQAP
jgi:hypothetical protein